MTDSPKESVISSDVLDLLARHGADSAALVAIGNQGTGADRTRAIVRRSLEALIGNGLITVNDPASWPEYVHLDPPYHW